MTECPLLRILPHMEMFPFAELAQHGQWPVAGGWLDQTAWWLNWSREANAQVAYWKERMTDGGS